MRAINSNIEALVQNIAQNTVNNGVTYSRDELEDLFADTSYFNAGEQGQEAIQEQIDNLEAMISTLKKQAEELEKEIEERELKVDDKADEMTDIIAQIGKKTAEYQQQIKLEAKQAAYDAIDSYRHDPNPDSFEECYNQAFKKRISGIAGINMGTIKNLYAEYDRIKDSVSPIMGQIEGYLNQAKDIQGKLNSTNATINLLTKTRDNMSDTIKNAYTNDDMDAKIPVFSGAKADVANEILANAAINNEIDDNPNPDGEEAGANAAAGGRTPEQQTAIDNAMAAYAQKNEGTGHNATWYATYSKSPQLQNLEQRVNGENMLEELQNLGATPDEILTFVSQTWNVGITRTVSADGTISYRIPNNTGDKGTYDKLNELALSGNQTKAAEVDPDALQNLKDKGLQALDTMYNAGFTFKEAMYVMTKAFPNSGLEYNLQTQSNERNYQIPEDTEESGTLYKDMADKILNYWNVGASAGDNGTIETERAHCDPIVFQDGNKTYTFINDRNSDGTFDYASGEDNDLMGSKDGISELLAYDYNNDGIINENDVDENGVSALDNLILMSNNQIESVDSAQDVDNYKFGPEYKNTVDFDITYTSASLAGITEIDLTEIKNSGNINGEDNVNENYNDINGSNVINQFTITKDGKEIQAKETLNTESNLETFYGQVAQNNTADMFSTISDEEFNAAFDNWYNDDAASANEIITGVIETLEDLKKQAEANENSFELTMDYDDFVEMYGADGKSGLYVEAARTSALRGAQRHTEKDEQEESATEVGKELDKLNESIKVDFKDKQEEENQLEVEEDK